MASNRRTLQINIRENIKRFLEGEGKNRGRNPSERYASFDYCFNYFQEFRESGRVSRLCDSKNMQASCLHLGFYLASWGMLRASSFLFERSVKHFEQTIDLIANYNSKIWSIDVDSYNESNIALLLDFRKKLVVSLGEENNPSDTLITKIMLGVFANTPAFDKNFRDGMKVRGFNKRSLTKLSSFYKENRVQIDSYKIKTYDFENGKDTERGYTKAKVIDMIGFIQGQKVAEKSNKTKRLKLKK